VTQPVPEENDEPLGLTEPPADEHDSEEPDEADAAPPGEAQQENAGTSLDQPSDDAE